MRIGFYVCVMWCLILGLVLSAFLLLDDMGLLF